MVYSAFRLVKAAADAGAKIVVVNVGETRADPLIDIKASLSTRSVVSTRLTMQQLQCQCTDWIKNFQLPPAKKHIVIDLEHIVLLLHSFLLYIWL